MDSGQADYIFVQAQEMFPQLEADVIHMILSENDFKMNEALPSLTMLTQTFSTDNSLIHTGRNPTAGASNQEKVTATCSQSSSTPNQNAKHKKRRKRAKTKNKSTQLATDPEKLDASSNKVEALTDVSDYCSVYLPYYENQVLDLDFHSSSVADYSQLESASNDLQIPPIEGLEPPVLSTKVLHSNSLAIPTKDNPEPVETPAEELAQTLVCEDTTPKTMAALNTDDIDKIKVNPMPSSVPSLLKKKFVLLSSYTAVGCANGKRCTYSGGDFTKRQKEDTNMSDTTVSNDQSVSVKNKTVQNRTVENIDSKRHQDELIGEDSKPMTDNSVKSAKQHMANMSQEAEKSIFGLSKVNPEIARAESPFKLDSINSVSTKSVSASNNTILSTSSKVISAGTPVNQTKESESPKADTKSLVVSSSSQESVAPLQYSTPLSWSRNNSESSDPIQFLAQSTSTQHHDSPNYESHQSSFNPPHLQRFSSLENPLPFQYPSYYADTSTGYSTYPMQPNLNFPPISSCDFPNVNGYNTPDHSQFAPWNNFRFQNSGHYNMNASAAYSGRNEQVHNHAIKNPNSQFSSEVSANKMFSEKTRSKHKNDTTSLWLYVMRGVPGSGKSTLAKTLNNGKGIILSTDEYFVTPKGYVFDSSVLSTAHMWNLKRAKHNMRKKISPVIIDNTNTTSSEMRPYMVMAVEHCYKIKIHEPNTRWKFKASELAWRNTHNVPKDKIKLMLERYEMNVTIRNVLGDDLYKQYETNCLKLTSDSQDSDSSKHKKTFDSTQNSIEETATNLQAHEPSKDNAVETKVSETPVNLTKYNMKSVVEKTNERSNAITDFSTDQNNDVSSNTNNPQNLPSSQTNGKRSTSVESPKETTTKDVLNSSKCVSNATEQESNSFKIETVQSPLSSSEQTDSFQTKGKSKHLNQNSETKNKTKKKTKTLAARFQIENQSKSLENSSNSWSSFMDVIEKQDIDSSMFEQNDSFVSQNTCDNQTNTDERYFDMIKRLDAGFGITTNETVFLSDSTRFQPATVTKLRKLKKPMYDKSTITEKIEEESNEENDIETLALLFPDYKRDDLSHIYSACNKKLDWTTDVIAESSLFGSPDLPRANTAEEETSPFSLDAYYDNLFGSKQGGTSEETSDVDKPTTSTAPDADKPFTVMAQDDEKSMVSAAISDDAGPLTLHLSASFLKQLALLFGDQTEEIEACSINVGYDLATAIYSMWKPSKEQSKNWTNEMLAISSLSTCAQQNVLTDRIHRLDQMKRDEELARRIQNEEDMKTRTPSPRQRRHRRQYNRSIFSPNGSDTSSASSGRWSVDRAQHPQTLNQIMKEESAAAKSVERQTTKFGKMKLAAQVKREELHAMYHTIPPTLLDDIFAANNYNLEETMFAVNCVFCEDDDLCFKTYTTVSHSLEKHFADRKKRNRPLNQDDVKDIVNRTKFRDISDLQQRIIEALDTVTVDMLARTWLEIEYRLDIPRAMDGAHVETPHLEPPDLDSDTDRLLTFDEVHSDLYTTYDDIRIEANMHRTQMHECQRKAAIANHQKKGALAHYYAQQAYQHQKLLREANQRAASVTYRRMNEGRSPNELDLHGLHVDEAIDTLRSVIHELQKDRTALRQLTVITGRGLNSSGGIPKIKNAVLEWLKNKLIVYEILNDGCVKITW